MREALYLLDDSRHLMSARVSRLAYRRRHGVRLKAVGCPFEIARRSVSIPTFETESLFRFAFRFPFRLHQIRALFIGRRRVRLKARGVLIGARVAFFAASEGGRFSLAASAAQTPAHVRARARHGRRGIEARRAHAPREVESRERASDRLGAHAPGHRAFAEGDANARAAGSPRGARAGKAPRARPDRRLVGREDRPRRRPGS